LGENSSTEKENNVVASSKKERKKERKKDSNFPSTQTSSTSPDRNFFALLKV
jgi:hypothetical protein